MSIVFSENLANQLLASVGRQLRPALPPIRTRDKPRHEDMFSDNIYYRRGLDTSVLTEIDLGSPVMER